jgi:hypothetical protein
MSSSEQVTGVILDPRGQPLAGVPVSFTSVAGPFEQRFVAMPPQRSDGRTQSGTDGSFSFDAIPGAVIADFRAEPDEFAVLHHSVRDQRGHVGAFRLSHGVRLTGAVVDVHGGPVSGVGIVVESVQRNDVGTPLARRHATTDEHGRFALAPLSPGGYEVKVTEMVGRDEGDKPRRVRLPAAFVPLRHVLTEDDHDRPIELRAVPHVTVRARFVDSQGAAVEATDLMFWGELNGSRVIARGLAGADGTVQVLLPRGLGDAHVMVSVLADGHVVRWRRGDRGPEHNGSTLQLGTLDEDAADLYVVRYRAPRLLVTASDVSGARVTSSVPRVAYARRDGLRPHGENWISGIRGDVDFFMLGNRWASRWLLPDEPFTLTVEAGGFQPASQDLTLGEGETRELDFCILAAQ